MRKSSCSGTSGRSQNIAANTGVFGNDYAAMNEKESLQWKLINSNKHHHNTLVSKVNRV